VVIVEILSMFTLTGPVRADADRVLTTPVSAQYET
jgi:hypothetical protein